MVNFAEMLDDNTKRSLLEQRIAQFAAEGYQHTLNKAVAEQSGNEEAVAQSDAAIAILSKSEEHTSELQSH